MIVGKQFLYLSQDDVQKVNMSMKEYIDILERAHMAKSNKEIQLPPKLHLDPTPDTFIEAMACSMLNVGPTGTKWLSGCATNQQRDLPRFMGFVILNDPESGAPIALMDCTNITGMRTAGVSGVALRHLANPDSEVVTVLGCGLEGRTNLEATLCECKQIKRVYAWGPRAATVDRYVAEMRAKFADYPITIEAVRDPKQAICEADVLLASSPITHGDEFKIIEPSWLKPGVTAVPVNMESHFKDESLKCFAKVYVDDLTIYHECVAQGHYRCLTEVPPEIGDMLTGKVPGRQSHDERIITFTGGIGLNDVSTGYRIFQLALERGIGTILPI